MRAANESRRGAGIRGPVMSWTPDWISRVGSGSRVLGGDGEPTLVHAVPLRMADFAGFVASCGTSGPFPGTIETILLLAGRAAL